jgi:hypothetical protein
MRLRSRLRARWVALATALLITGGMGLAAVTASPPALAENNGIATNAPLMGWSSWSFLRHSPTAANVEAQASAMASSGLKAATECLDVYSNETAPGTKVELWPCGGANQKWSWAYW